MSEFPHTKWVNKYRWYIYSDSYSRKKINEYRFVSILADKTRDVCGIICRLCNVDLSKYCEYVDNCIKIVDSFREYSDEEFHSLFLNVENILNSLEEMVKTPKIIRLHSKRNNISADWPEQYFKKSLSFFF